jgi:hypothetical protein
MISFVAMRKRQSLTSAPWPGPFEAMESRFSGQASAIATDAH